MVNSFSVPFIICDYKKTQRCRETINLNQYSSMDSQILISELENIISEMVFIKIENWNLYLGDAGLARNLAIECISNKDKDLLETAKISLKKINVKVGDGVNSIPLINLVTASQILELEEILESFFN